MKLLRITLVAIALTLCISNFSYATLIFYSDNPNVAPGPLMYEDRFGPNNPNFQSNAWDGWPTPFLIEYGTAPKTVFGPGDYVYLGLALVDTALKTADMIDVNGTKYFPRQWYQVWAPGTPSNGSATWEYITPSTETSWNDFLLYRGHISGVHFDSYYSSLPAPSDVWTLAGGYQPGQWNFRISIEVPSAGGDPWVTALPGGTWSFEWSPDPVSGNPPSNLGVSGSVTAAAVPEPATMLLLGSGLVGLAGLRRKFKK